MDLLQVSVKTAQNVVQDVWAANLITGAVILAVIGWLFKKWWDTVEQRFESARIEAKDAMKKASEAKEHGEEIEKNYVKRFEDVHREMESNKNQIKDHFTKEIKEVVHDKNNYRQTQAIVTTEIATNLANMIKTFDEIKRQIFK